MAAAARAAFLRVPLPRAMLYAQTSLPAVWLTGQLAAESALGAAFCLELAFLGWLRRAKQHYEAQPAAAPPEHNADDTLRRIWKHSELMQWGEQEWRRFFTGWCRLPAKQVPSREDVGAWVAWAFFQLDSSKLSDVDRRRVDGVLDEFERRGGTKFRAGRDPEARVMRPSIDPLGVSWRPLVAYTLPLALKSWSRWALRSAGFEQAQCGNLSYWLSRPLGKEADGPPIVILHGLGVGLAPYVRMAKALRARFPSRAVALVDTPEVSMTLGEDIVPDEQSAVAELTQLLDTVLHAPQAAFIAHSYGTMRLRWLLHSHPERVSHAVLLDPVSFLLFLPDLAFKTIYDPCNTQQQYVRREISTAHVLSRHFWWYRNWQDAHGLPRGRTVVVLGGRDKLVPVDDIRRWLEREAPGVRVVWNDALGHAQMLWNKDAIDTMVETFAALPPAVPGSPARAEVE
eukprot:TRINITY_DN14717_c0_g1_i1.p1 TRINITY_DN14717_c0_g1~~TRINITY_DN14717_c0_g1_i1.p1  ORF type:complete len:487 (+),score=150.24 TRINITY_DN14717_c0_g1_i1:94-1461(+)